MTNLVYRRRIRNAVMGITRSIRIGRSIHLASVTFSTPVVKVADSDIAPRVVGHPYLKTAFRNGPFKKILYTPSTMRIEVGSDWSPYDNDNH